MSDGQIYLTERIYLKAVYRFVVIVEEIWYERPKSKHREFVVTQRFVHWFCTSVQATKYRLNSVFCLIIVLW